MIDAKILVVDDNKSVLSALEILLQFEYSSVQPFLTQTKFLLSPSSKK